MRTLALCGASCKRRSFFYCTGAAWKSLRLLPLLMVEGCVGRSWAVWTGAMGFADELRMYGVLRSSHVSHSGKSDVRGVPIRRAWWHL
jgi:hypothetical protein